jgi:hypothetical protein
MHNYEKTNDNLKFLKNVASFISLLNNIKQRKGNRVNPILPATFNSECYMEHGETLETVPNVSQVAYVRVLKLSSILA